MTALEVLIAARGKIADPKHWTQEAFARRLPDEEEGQEVGSDIDPCKPSAVCWCATGAIAAVQGAASPDWGDVFESAFGMSDGSVENFNDAHTHAEVIALFDKAIGYLKGGKP
jgi:hypothetical protein